MNSRLSSKKLSSPREMHFRESASLIFSIGMILTLGHSALAAARFTGGMCISQGTWIQAALQQSETISEAINSLRNDPACGALIKALEASPKFNKSEVESGENNAEVSSYANVFKELSAFSELMKPKATIGNSGAQGQVALKDTDFRNIVFNLVFNKSFHTIKDLNSQPELASLSKEQQEHALSVSNRLKSFLRRSKDVVNMSMAAGKGILAALPESKMCLHNHPSQTAAIFGAIAQSAAALTTGGEVNGVGEFISSILQYNREMSYVNALQPIEKERFQSSVSCLLESTSEAYCSVQDAEDSLDYLKEFNLSDRQQTLIHQTISNKEQDPIANPLGGLIILMRDVPVLQGWMQRVLFGIDPKLKIEADMKNSNWSSILGFLQSVNSLQGEFRDKEQLYYQAKDLDNIQKLAQIRQILDNIVDNFRKGGSFFERVFPSYQSTKFILLGVPVPKDLSNMNDFDTFWNRWVNEGSNGFNNPDQLLATVKDQLWGAIEKAQKQANILFASRMIVDPQNLLAEAMKGPGVSPYQALVDLRRYNQNLARKLRLSVARLEDDPLQEVRKVQLQAQIPLLEDSVDQIDRITSALKSTASIKKTGDESAKMQSQKVMDVIYEAANMMVSRDSFFGTRMTTAVQADISDTLWRRENLTDQQYNLFLAIGPEIVNRLSGYFTSNPVFQRADVSQAKLIHMTNLRSTENLFAKVLFNQLIDLNCKLEGGIFCSEVDGNYDPGRGDIRLNEFNEQMANLRKSKGDWFYRSGLRISRFYDWMYKPTEDSNAHKQTRAKLCIQALAFGSRDMFAELCYGAVLQSDFANKSDTFGLNVSFNDKLKEINAQLSSKKDDSNLDKTRTLGVCALRSYLRKNHIFYMYREYMKEK